MTIRNIDWMTGALCAQIGPELFFPGKGESSRHAKALCASCPVRQECAEWALAELTPTDDAYGYSGVWGGTSPRDRSKARKENAA